jgi:hypothetical protein
MYTVNRELLSKARAILSERLNLFWIIGGSCSGKTTIARAISQAKNLPIYDMDAQIFGDYMARYTAERHPASRTWFSAENSLHWALSLSWEQWNGLNQAATAEQLDLIADDIRKHDGDRPLLIDGGITHPSILTRVFPAGQVVCIDAPDAMRARAWKTSEERAQMKGWIMDLPNPEDMWAKFLAFDRLMTRVIVEESRQAGIKIFHRTESTAVDLLAGDIMRHFRI